MTHPNPQKEYNNDLPLDKCCEKCRVMNFKGLLKDIGNGTSKEQPYVCLNNNCPCHKQPQYDLTNDVESLSYFNVGNKEEANTNDWEYTANPDLKDTDKVTITIGKLNSILSQQRQAEVERIKRELIEKIPDFERTAFDYDLGKIKSLITNIK